MGAEVDIDRSGDDPAHPSDGSDQLGDRVLGRHCIVEQRRVEGPAGLALEHPGGIDDRAHGVEDPLGTIRLAQPGAPIGEHRVVEPFVSQGQATGHLPADAVPQGPGGVTVRESLEGLEDHD